MVDDGSPLIAATPPACLARWTAELHGVGDASMALAIGVFNLAGDALYLNRGMAEVLGGDTPDRPRCRYLVNPRFEQLWTDPSADGLVFGGWLTVGGTDAANQPHAPRPDLPQKLRNC